MLDSMMLLAFAALALVMAGLVKWSDEIVKEGRGEK
ncbi:signal peptide protein [Metabacillus idriensis]|nr:MULTISPECIES: hypothetical protein [Bacillaceae]MDR0139840.1 signal peptide protein [Metabacillus idriensis]TDL78738.1 signal peptide protein [Peribacillus frigoritolerans]